MKKLSQKEILDEGFGNMMKSLVSKAAGLAKGTAKMISPTAAKVAKSAADKVGAAIGNVLSSPTAAINEYFNRPEIKSKYDGLEIGKETKLNNYRRQIELEFRDVRKNEQVKTTVEAYRTDEGGTSPETWSFEKIKTTDGSSIGPDGAGSGKKAGGKAGDLVDDTLRGLGGLGVDAAKGLGGLGVDAAKGTGGLAKQGVKRVTSDEYKKAKEMPSSNEWEQSPEDKKFAVPQPDKKEVDSKVKEKAKSANNKTSITPETIAIAIDAAGKPGFQTNTLSKKALGEVKTLLKPNSDKIKNGLRPTINGLKIPNKAARAILASESKKSQKSLLKHLQSWSS